MELLAHHLDDLRRSGLTDETIRQAGYRRTHLLHVLAYQGRDVLYVFCRDARTICHRLDVLLKRTEQPPELHEKQEGNHQEQDRYHGDHDRRDLGRDLKGIRCGARYPLLQRKNRDGKQTSHHTER